MQAQSQSSRFGSEVDFTKPLDLSTLRDASVVVTGGASGLGRGVAIALAEAGAYVTVLDISPTAGRDVEDTARQRSLK